MSPNRFQEIARRYAAFRIAIVGDFCLDRYLEIDPTRRETSLETGLPVHNVVKVRAQPGGAGTILNNLIALGVGEIYPVGFAGVDGEGFELRRALASQAAVRLDYFVETPLRRTFTYCKPLVIEAGKPPVELNRLDSKNWTSTPAVVQDQIIQALHKLAPQVHAIIVLDQVDVAETGVVCAPVLEAIRHVAQQNPNLPIIGDSRRGLRHYPPIIFKMNLAEFGALTGLREQPDPTQLREQVGTFARGLGKPVFVTASTQGIIGAEPTGRVEHVPAMPVRGPIDIVGAGDAVTANLVAALAAGADLRETMEIANAAASVVVHKLGTTGTASINEILALM
jgi:rfaE bifunctional protein kinase chain/domain